MSPLVQEVTRRFHAEFDYEREAANQATACSAAACSAESTPHELLITHLNSPGFAARRHAPPDYLLTNSSLSTLIHEAFLRDGMLRRINPSLSPHYAPQFTRRCCATACSAPHTAGGWRCPSRCRRSPHAACSSWNSSTARSSRPSPLCYYVHMCVCSLAPMSLSRRKARSRHRASASAGLNI